MDMPLFYGLLGLFTILFLWPIGLILHLTGAENFEFPRTKQDLYAIMINV
jgi:solute carrier family 35, member F5